MASARKRIAVWSPYMGHVGTIKAVANLCRGFSEAGLEVDLFKVRGEWEGLEAFFRRHGVRIVDFKGSRVFPRLPRYGAGYRLSMLILSIYSFPLLLAYLWRRRPDYLLVCLLGFLPMLVLRLCPAKPTVVLSVQGIPTFNRVRKALWKRFQARADAVVVLTENTQHLLRRDTTIPPERIFRVDNPVVDEAMAEMALEEPGHPWFAAKDVPVLVGVGRLTRQKDFTTLLKAFARVRAVRPCRLAILGEGEQRRALEALAAELGVAGDLYMPGFVRNPFQFMARSDLFVLSSLWEDPGHVLMEAAALGVPIVATDCPSGPRDFLEGGRLGTLCPMSDPDALAAAILESLGRGGRDSGTLEAAREKARRYSVPFSAASYLAVFEGRARPVTEVHGHPVAVR